LNGDIDWDIFAKAGVDIAIDDAVVVVYECSDAYIAERTLRGYAQRRVRNAQSAYEVREIKCIEHRQAEIHDYSVSVAQGGTVFLFLRVPVVKPIKFGIIPKVALVDRKNQFGVLAPAKCANVAVAEWYSLHWVFWRAEIYEIVPRYSPRPVDIPSGVFDVESRFHK